MISTLSNLIAELSLRPRWHVTQHLHVISARCVARNLHTVAPGPLKRSPTCRRQFAALRGDCKKSPIAPLNVIIINININININIIIIIIIIITGIKISDDNVHDQYMTHKFRNVVQHVNVMVSVPHLLAHLHTYHST